MPPTPLSPDQQDPNAGDPLGNLYRTSSAPVLTPESRSNGFFTVRDQGAYGPQDFMSQLQSALGPFRNLLPQINEMLLGSNFQSADPTESLTALRSLLSGAGSMNDPQRADLTSLLGEARTANDPLRADINALRGQVGNDFGFTSGALRGIASGSSDPAYAEYGNARLAQLDSQRRAAVEQATENARRAGLTGSALDNEVRRIADQFDQQARTLTGELGLSALGRRDTALRDVASLSGNRAGIESGLIGQLAGLNQTDLGNQSSLIGQLTDLNQTDLGNQSTLAQTIFGIQSGAAGQANQAEAARLGSAQDALQNLLAGPELMVGAETARNAGNTDGGGGPSVICTELHRHGDLPEHVWKADTEFGACRVSREVYAGYLRFAVPVVALMQRSRAVYRIVRWFALRWAYQMAYEMGAHDRPNLVGCLIMSAMPICAWLGRKEKVRWQSTPAI